MHWHALRLPAKANAGLAAVQQRQCSHPVKRGVHVALHSLLLENKCSMDRESVTFTLRTCDRVGGGSWEAGGTARTVHLKVPMNPGLACSCRLSAG
jgi:hypothetical protein